MAPLGELVPDTPADADDGSADSDKPPQRSATSPSFVTFRAHDGVQFEFNGAAIAHKPGVGTVTFEKNGRKYAISHMLDRLNFEHDTNGMLEAIGGSKRAAVRYSIGMLMIAAALRMTQPEDISEKIEGARDFLEHFRRHFPVLEHYIVTGEPPRGEDFVASA